MFFLVSVLKEDMVRLTASYYDFIDPVEVFHTSTLTTLMGCRVYPLHRTGTRPRGLLRIPLNSQSSFKDSFSLVIS